MTKNTLTTFSLVVLAMLLATDGSFAQDSVFLNTGRPVRGKIKVSNPDEVIVGDQTVQVKDIKRITLATAPRELGRAQEDLDAGQYEDAMAQIQKIKEIPTDPVAKQEYDYVVGIIKGQIALKTGQISVVEARNELGDFIKNHPKSFRYYPIVELYGQLCVNTNELELADRAFQILSGSTIPEYELKGLFELGQVKLLNAIIKDDSSQFSEAASAFTKLSNHELNDELAQSYKLLAKCQNAKAMAGGGQVDEAQKIIEKIIDDQNPDNKQLFAYCYNALGFCHQKKNDTTAAALAYLHTDLLFSMEADAHAEALYNLCQIWPALEKTDRANRARQMLNANYANSIWRQKLN